MYWEVLIPGDDQGTLAKSVTVEADTWFAALREGMAKGGAKGSLLSNLSCQIKPDKSVHISDIISQKTYVLRQVEGPKKRSVSTRPDSSPVGLGTPKAKNVKPQRKTKPPAPLVKIVTPSTPPEEEIPTRNLRPQKSRSKKRSTPSPTIEPQGKGASEKRATISNLEKEQTSKLPDSKLFFSKDEKSSSVKPIYYRERLLAVNEGTSRHDAGRLALSVFKSLKKVEKAPDAKLYITVQIYDHSFKEESLRPAIAALAWKEWNPEETLIQFPLSGDRGVRLSRVPTPPRRLKKRPVSIPAGLMGTPPDSKSTSSDLPVEEIIVQAFEKMQGIYELRDHDSAALFVLELATEFVSCEAGSVMLITPGRYELYVAAACGPVAKAILGKRLSLLKGIVGFSTRTGTVITVTDPKNDQRFNDRLDSITGFNTSSVVCAPIQYEGKTIGAIELLNSRRENGFIQEEANVLSYIAGAAGEYIDTSLPSREADFSDRDFRDVRRSKTKVKKKRAKKKGIAKKSKTKKESAKNTEEKKTKAKTKKSKDKKPSRKGLAIPGVKQKKRKPKK